MRQAEPVKSGGLSNKVGLVEPKRDQPVQDFSAVQVFLMRQDKMMVRIENILSSRELAGLYRDMDNSELDEIIQLTGCPKPCFYKKYNFLGEKYISSFVTDHFLLSLWAVSNITRVETEQLIYPWTSLVAEFGGALGLFLGISFMSLWEGIYLLKPCFKY